MSRSPARTRDDGASLVEIVVTMGLMGVLMAVFTGAIVQMYRATARTETAATAASEVRNAFQQLDRLIRYASWIDTPGKVGTSWYVEFADATGRCGQLRLDNRGVLQMLRWTPGAPPVSGQSGQTLASQLVVDDAVPPFAMQAAGTTVVGGSMMDRQRLEVRLTATVGGASTVLDSTFTATNTSRVTPATNACGEGRPSS